MYVVSTPVISLLDTPSQRSRAVPPRFGRLNCMDVSLEYKCSLFRRLLSGQQAVPFQTLLSLGDRAGSFNRSNMKAA